MSHLGKTLLGNKTLLNVSIGIRVVQALLDCRCMMWYYAGCCMMLGAV